MPDDARESEWHKAHYSIMSDHTLPPRAPSHFASIKDDLIEQRGALIAYLLSKVKAADWHAVQDAASDIREINAKLDVLGA